MIIKRFLKFIFLLFFIAINSQKVSDSLSDLKEYSVIYVPKQFKDSKVNQYGLNDLLSKELKSKKFQVNNEIINFNCESVKVEISDNSTMFSNRILINFIDCHDKIIATYNGKSSIKDFEPGMRNALENAIKNIPVSNPFSENVVLVGIDKKSAKEIGTIVKAEDLQESSLENYTNGIITLKKTFSPHAEFILKNPKDNIPYAIFRKSTKKDVYRVQLNDGSFTIGYLENGKIVIEILDDDGSLRTEIF